MKKQILGLTIIGILTLWSEATELKRTGWNLIAVCQEINRSQVDMTGIKEIQNQNGQSIYTGEFSSFSNLEHLEAGYGYWVHGDSGTQFNSGETAEKLIKPLTRTGWNLMASCEDRPSSDINMSSLQEIQNQDGESIYIGEFASNSNLQSLENGYGYWVKGEERVLFSSKEDLTVPSKFLFEPIDNVGQVQELTYQGYRIKLFSDVNVTLNSQAQNRDLFLYYSDGNVTKFQIQEGYQRGAIMVGIYNNSGELLLVSNPTIVSNDGSIGIDIDFNLPDTEENVNDSYTYLPKTITDKVAVRFLNKATFGATKESIQEFKELGVLKWLDKQLNMPLTDEQLHLSTTIGIAKQFEPENFTNNVEAYLEDNDVVFNKAKASFQLRRYQNSAWFSVALFQEDQLREKLTYALSQIVVESLAEPIFTRRAEAIARYFDILRVNAFGNYKDLLLDISHSSSMSLYLTYNGNKKEHIQGESVVYPDENYAREIMQLFSIGLEELNIDGTAIIDENGNSVPTYTQKDITEVAKVFTGWDIKRNPRYGLIGFTRGDLTHPCEFTSEHHAFEEKKILGETIVAGLGGDEDMEALITILMNHKNVAPFISKTLIQRLTKSNPSPAYVRRVAKVFNDNGLGVKGDLKTVVKAIFLDTEFWDDIKNENVVKFKEPLVALTQFYRAFNAEPFDKFKLKGKSTYIRDVFFLNEPSSIGQVPGRAFSVFNFYDKDFIPNDNYFKVNRLVASELQIQSEATIISLNNHLFDRLGVFEKKVVGSGGGNIRWDRIVLDCSAEDEVIELELEGSVDGNISNLEDLSLSSDKEQYENNQTKREEALIHLIQHLDKKITGGRLPQKFKDELFQRHIETFYSSRVENEEDKTKREIYKWITVPLIVAIMTSNINMTE